MKKKLVIEYQEFSSADKLPKEDAELLKEAISATQLSYSPFSNFNGIYILIFFFFSGNRGNCVFPSKNDILENESHYIH